MENIKINFAHICDMAFLSQGGKANIIGIFKVIFANSFPTVHPKFSIITSFSLKNLEGAHTQVIKIVHAEDGKEIGRPISIEFIANKEMEEINFIGDVLNTSFDRPGKYFIRIYIDNGLIHSAPLDVIKR